MAADRKKMAPGESICNCCGELILWVTMVSARNPAGKPHPLDPVPSLDGTIERSRKAPWAADIAGCDGWYARVVPWEQRRLGRRMYVSHVATCSSRYRGVRA